MWAVWLADTNRTLIEEGANLNGKLTEAARDAYISSVAVLLEKGTDKDERSPHGKTGKDYARQQSHYEIASL